MIIAALLLMQAVTPGHVRNVEREVPAIRQHLDAQLIDYPTARFRDVRVTANPEAEAERGVVGGYLCGFVNSKNRMGGYVGWQRFMASGAGVYVEGDSIADIVIPNACGSTSINDPVDRSDWLLYR